MAKTWDSASPWGGGYSIAYLCFVGGPILRCVRTGTFIPKLENNQPTFLSLTQKTAKRKKTLTTRKKWQQKKTREFRLLLRTKKTRRAPNFLHLLICLLYLLFFGTTRFLLFWLQVATEKQLRNNCLSFKLHWGWSWCLPTPHVHAASVGLAFRVALWVSYNAGHALACPCRFLWGENTTSPESF